MRQFTWQKYCQLKCVSDKKVKNQYDGKENYIQIKQELVKDKIYKNKTKQNKINKSCNEYFHVHYIN